MNWYSNLQIKGKLMVGFGLVLTVVIIQSLLSYRTSNMVKSTTDELAREGLIDDRQMAARYSLATMQRCYRGYLLTGAEGELTCFNEAKSTYEAMMSELDNMAKRESVRSKLSDAKQKAQVWQSQVVEPGLALVGEPARGPYRAGLGGQG